MNAGGAGETIPLIAATLAPAIDPGLSGIGIG